MLVQRRKTRLFFFLKKKKQDIRVETGAVCECKQPDEKEQAVCAWDSLW